MRVRHLLASLSAASLLLSGCERKEENEAHEFTAQDEAAIRAAGDSVVTYVRAANWASWAGLFSDDAVFHPSNGKALQGRTAIENWGKTLPPIEHFEFFDVKVVGSGDLAYYTSGVAIKMKDVPADTSKQLAVFKHTDGGWKVVAGSVNSDLPLPGAAPATKTSTKTKRPG